MATKYEVVDEGHSSGNGGKIRSEWKTIRAVFNNFESLPSKRGEVTKSPVLKCHGLDWQVKLNPGGNDESSKDIPCISLSLNCMSCTTTEKRYEAAFDFRIPSAGHANGSRGKFFTFSRNTEWAINNYAYQANVRDVSKNFLVNGDLIVEVDIQVMLDPPLIWTPPNTVCSDMLKMLEAGSSDNCDVTFEVGPNEPKVFHAHRNILVARAPAIADFIADISDPSSMIPIKDVEPTIFRMVLRFIYGGEVPAKNVLAENARDIIHAADKYGGTGLKLAAEAQLTSDGITTENAAELILFADATNCAMLKEAAMEHFAKNAQAVMASEGFEQVAESPAIMREMMAVGFGGSKKRSASSDADSDRDYKRMRVATLRQKLDEKKLDVDGSKEMLISRLEAADAEAQAAAQAAAQAEAENKNDEEESDHAED